MDIFIVGTSGSTTQEDLSLLKGKRVFGLNTLPFCAPEIITDYVAIEMSLAFVPELRDSLPPSANRYYSNYFWNSIPDEMPERTQSFKLISGSKSGFSLNPESLYQAETVAFTALQLAAQLNPDRIILVGIDLDPEQGHLHGSERFRQLLNAKRLRDPMYGKDALNRGLDLKVANQRFGIAKHHCDALGIEVINCSRKSKLNAFPKMPLNEIVQQPVLV